MRGRLYTNHIWCSDCFAFRSRNGMSPYLNTGLSGWQHPGTSGIRGHNLSHISSYGKCYGRNHRGSACT